MITKANIPPSMPKTNSLIRIGHSDKIGCKYSILCANMPPETSNNAMVPTTENILITIGKALTND